MIDKMLEDYAVFDAQIKILTKKKDELKGKILWEMLEKKKRAIYAPTGTFTVSNLKTWKYTPKVAALEETFKAQKAIEQSTGDATFEEKPSLRYVTAKL